DALAARHDVTLVGFTWSAAAGEPSIPVRTVAVEWNPPPVYADMLGADPAVAQEAYARGLVDPEPWFVSYYQSTSMDETLARVGREAFDLVMIEHSIMGRFLPCLPTEVPRLLDLHNIHSLMLERAEPDTHEFERTRTFETAVVTACDVCVTVSRPEAEAA